VLAEKEAEEEELAEDNQPVTSDEAKRDQARGAREDRQETQPHENGAQSPARAGARRQEDPQKRR
jgi:hypothetical protein